MAGWGIRMLRISTLTPWTSERDVKITLGKYGEVREMWSAVYRCKVKNGIRVVLLDLKQHILLHGHWRVQGLHLIWGSTTHILPFQRDGGRKVHECRKRIRTQIQPFHTEPLTWATVATADKRESKVTETPTTTTGLSDPKRHES
jgi:hypothetical protein